MRQSGTCGVIAAAVLCAVVSVPLDRVALAAEVEGPKIKWTFAAHGGRRAPTSNLHYLAENVSAATSGNFTIDVVYETLSQPKDYLDGIKIGAFEGAWVIGTNHPGKTPTLIALSLPLLPGFDNLQSQKRILVDFYTLPEVAADLRKWDAVYLMPSLIEPYKLAGRGEAPLTIDAMKNRRVRAPGGMGDAMKKLGAVPTTVPGPETYGALERGIFDSLAFPMSAHMSYKTYELLDWYASNLSIGITPIVTPVKTDAFNNLPAQYRALLAKFVPVALDQQIDAFTKEEAPALALLEKRGTKTIVYPQETIERIAKIAGEPVWDEWVADAEKNGVPGRRLLQHILESAKKAAM